MKSIRIRHIIFSALAAGAFWLGGCKKIAGLQLQEDQQHITHTIDPNINKTAWQYLKDRALGTSDNPNDTIFRFMYQGIVYSGIDTAEYLKPDRTFIFLYNDAVYRKSGSSTATDCFFGRYKVNNAAATKWQQYTPQFVKNYLMYLIVPGHYNFDNVTPDNTIVTTLLPQGADTLNPTSIMAFRVINDRNSKFRINDFTGTVPYATQRYVEARTAGLISTNGTIHVVDRVVEYRVK